MKFNFDVSVSNCLVRRFHLHVVTLSASVLIQRRILMSLNAPEETTLWFFIAHLIVWMFLLSLYPVLGVKWMSVVTSWQVCQKFQGICTIPCLLHVQTGWGRTVGKNWKKIRKPIYLSLKTTCKYFIVCLPILYKLLNSTCAHFNVVCSAGVFNEYK